MKKLSAKLGIFLPIIFVAIIISVAFRTTASLNELDFTSGDIGLIYYDGDALINSANWIVVAAAVLSLSFMFLIGKFNPIVSFDTPATYIPAGGVSVALLFIAAGLIYDLREITSGVYSSDIAFSFSGLLILILSLLAVACAINFFFNSFYQKNKSTTRASFAILATLFLAGYAAYLYFDTSLPKNAPSRVIDEMTYLFTAIFFLYETRISLGRKLMKAYVSFAMIAAILTAYSSIPTIIVYFAKGAMLSMSIQESVLTLLLFFYISSRLLQLLFGGEDTISPVTEAVLKLSSDRQAELNELYNAQSELLARDINNNVENAFPDNNENIDFDNEDELFTQQTIDIEEPIISEDEVTEE